MSIEQARLFVPVAADFPISSGYGPRIHPLTKEPGRMHYGIDFACPEGTPVVAAVTGKVVLAGWEDSKDWMKGFGLRVWQKMGNTEIYVVYGHLSKLACLSSDYVVAGTRIGLSGNTGGSSGPHLHLEMRIGGISGVKGSPIEFVEAA